jgi:hypothetical protein
MKSIIKFSIIIFAFLILGNVRAQIPPNEQIVPIEDRFENNTILDPNKPIYYKDENNLFDKFMGNWKHQNTNIELTISISEMAHRSLNRGAYENDNFDDALIVRIKLKVNGFVKYNTFNSQKGLIVGNIINSTNEIQLSYNEPSLTSCHRSRNADLVLEFLGGNPAKLRWNRINTTSGIQKLPCEDGTEPDDSEFSIPENLILTKQ